MSLQLGKHTVVKTKKHFSLHFLPCRASTSDKSGTFRSEGCQLRFKVNVVKEEDRRAPWEVSRVKRARCQRSRSEVPTTLGYRRSYSGYHNRCPTRVLCRRPSRVTTQQVHRAKWDSLRVRERRSSDGSASRRLQPRRVFRGFFFSGGSENVPTHSPSHRVPVLSTVFSVLGVIYFCI